MSESTTDGEHFAAAPAGPGEDELDGLRQQLVARDASQAAILSRLREALLASDAAIDPSLVQGSTLEAIEASFASAKAMAERIREGVRREQAAAIPAGAGLRTPPAPRSAFEKIRAGLGGQ